MPNVSAAAEPEKPGWRIPESSRPSDRRNEMPLAIIIMLSVTMKGGIGTR